MEENQTSQPLLDESQDKLEVATSQTNQFKLSNFEGPLDLLLHLIKDAKLDIANVKLSEITEQYLDFMKQIPDLNMENASAFIVMAATLIEIKSKSVLPVLEEEVFEEESSEELIRRQLVEYQIFKEASEELKNIENIDRLWRQPDQKANQVKIVLKDMALENMLNAFAELLQKIALKEVVAEPKQIRKDRFTVAEKIAAIKDAILFDKVIKFDDLVSEENSRSEVITVFLAVLELLKLQVIAVKQQALFGEIWIEKQQGEEHESITRIDH